MTERERESPKRRFSQRTADFRRFAPSPGNSSIWRAQETADLRGKPKTFAENRKKPQIGLRHLRCVTFSSALNYLRNSFVAHGTEVRGHDKKLVVGGASASWTEFSVIGLSDDADSLALSHCLLLGVVGLQQRSRSA